MPIVVLAEKPSAGQEIAKWLAKSNGPARRVGNTHIQVGDYQVTWLFGHVLQNLEPHEYDPAYKIWRASDLPIIPKEWKLSPKKDAVQHLRTVKALILASTSVIGAADPDQEGQLLQDEFLLYIGCKKPVKRLWLAAFDDASIQKSWKAMKPNEDYAGFYWSALARSHADWITGMNLSRACSLAHQSVYRDRAVLTVGRVQTPTLGLIVNREIEIENFKPTQYFNPYINLKTSPTFKAMWQPAEPDSRVDSEKRLTDKAHANAIVATGKKEGRAQVEDVIQTNGKENPPLPFSLSTLQEHMSRIAKLGVQKTLDIAQSLYEKKLTSYPRTDCEYLPKSQHEEAGQVMNGWGAGATAGMAKAVKGANLGLQSRAFNDKNITAHHAMVPRPVTAAQLAELSDIERKVWLEIAKRYVLQFYPAAEYLATELLLRCGPEQFKATGKCYTLRGWKDAFGEETNPADLAAKKTAGAKEGTETKDSDQNLPKVSKGDSLTIAECGMDTVTTKPPKRFTEGTLVNAMKGIHKYVKEPTLKAILRENIGIGTEATRGRIITELTKRKFIEESKSYLVPTQLGRSLISSLPAQVCSPDMTALWQQAMEDIRSTGSRGYTDFMGKQEIWLRELLKKAPSWFIKR